VCKHSFEKNLDRTLVLRYIKEGIYVRGVNTVKKIFILFVSIVITAVFIVSIANANARDENKVAIDIEYLTVTVEQGDTLWSLAKPHFNGKMDYREYIYQIKSLNQLEQGLIYPGQKLRIPLL